MYFSYCIDLRGKTVILFSAKSRDESVFFLGELQPFSFLKEAFMTLRVTHENENNLAATDHSIISPNFQS